MNTLYRELDWKSNEEDKKLAIKMWELANINYVESLGWTLYLNRKNNLEKEINDAIDKINKEQ